MTESEHAQLLAEFLRRQGAITPDTPLQERLRIELLRRRIRPAYSEQQGATVPEAVTVEDLEAELAAIPSHDEGRGWLEWELALAREQYALTPDVPFVRQVPAPGAGL